MGVPICMLVHHSPPPITRIRTFTLRKCSCAPLRNSACNGWVCGYSALQAGVAKVMKLIAESDV